MFALIAAAILWVGGRDWRFGIPVVGVLSSWLPWFAYQSRPLFFFYAIAIIPFSVMAISLCARMDSSATRRTGDRRMVGAIVVGAFVALVAANFAYLYPILTDQLLPYPTGCPGCGSGPGSDFALLSTVIAGPPAAGSRFP